VKQYSSDVAIALLLYALTLNIYSQRNPSLPYIFLYGIVGAIAIWFSNPSVFVLAGIGLGLLLMRVSRKEWSGIGRLLTIFSIWALSFIIFYIYTVFPLSKSGVVNAMQQMWKSSFMPFPPLSLSDFEWYIDKFFGIFSNPVGIFFSGVASLAFVAGCISLFARNKEGVFILLLPVAITLVASGFHIYPFTDRFLLFLVPSFLLLIAEGAEYIRDKTKSSAPLIGGLLIGLLLLHPALSAANHAVTQKPYASKPNEDIKTVMHYMHEHKKNGDAIYLYYASKFAFKYYEKCYGFKDSEYIVGTFSRRDGKGYIQDLNKLRGKGRVWFLFSHALTSTGFDEEKLFVFYLDTIGTRLDYLKADGAAIYLYDLSKEV
jgi:hypothetical protein